jgi:hypothetical protein
MSGLSGGLARERGSLRLPSRSTSERREVLPVLWVGPDRRVDGPRARVRIARSRGWCPAVTTKLGDWGAGGQATFKHWTGDEFEDQGDESDE